MVHHVIVCLLHSHQPPSSCLCTEVIYQQTRCYVLCFLNRIHERSIRHRSAHSKLGGTVASSDWLNNTPVYNNQASRHVQYMWIYLYIYRRGKRIGLFRVCYFFFFIFSCFSNFPYYFLPLIRYFSRVGIAFVFYP